LHTVSLSRIKKIVYLIMKGFTGIQKVLFLLVICFIGCEKEKVNVKQPSWEPHPQFELASKVKFNSYSTNDELYLYGPYYFSVLDKQGQVKNYTTVLDYPYGKKLAITKDLYVEMSLISHYMRIAKVKDPENSNLSPLVDLKLYDEYFTNFNFDSYAYNPSLAINDLNQLLISVYTNTPDNKVYVYLLDVDITSLVLKIANFKKIAIPGVANLGGSHPNYIKAIDDFFLVSTADGTQKVYSDGAVKKVLNSRILEVFKKNGKLYAFFEPDKLYISKDNGETWKEFVGIDSRIVNALYYNVGDSLTFYKGSQLFSAKFEEANYSIRELKNEGIEGNQITSISEFNDSVFVTSYSGVFYKSKSHFFESKK
jgi:hypothetical protein